MSLAINTPAVLNATTTGSFGAISIKAMFDQIAQKYTTVSLGIQNPMDAVTPSRIRRLRLGQMRRDALREELKAANASLLNVPAVKSYFAGKKGRAVAKKNVTDPTVEQLETAATIYRLARLVGDYPIKAVELSFALDARDARTWVARARQEGVL